MSRRSSGLIGVWAEAQRQQQRQREAQERAAFRQQRDTERQQRAYAREVARYGREQQAEYRRQREAEARRRTEELDACVAVLEGLLAAGCRAPAFRTSALTRVEEIEPFAPGQLAYPVPLPDPARYQPQAGGWTAGRRAAAQQEAQARYAHDLHAAQQAEGRRLEQLGAYRRQYDAWARGRLAEVRAYNAGVAATVEALRAGDPETVVEYFSAALYASTGWPEDFPRQVSAAFDRGAGQLVLDWELPGYAVVPEVKAVRFAPSLDQDKESARPVTQRRALYRAVLAQCVLLVLRDLFAADEFRTVRSVALNGFVDDFDPATGRRARVCLASVLAERDAFDGLNLELVSAVDCLAEGLRGQLSARPDQRAAVRPVRRPDEVGSGVVSHGGGEEPDLLAMDPVEFESLVAELFRARGMRAVMTQRSNDGGVDVDALDPDPISGGKIIVQVKRYRGTVSPSAVRDLYGTVQGAGANKGVLVTTSGFGPGSYTFANGKPLTLISGTELVDLLHQHGLRGRLGDGGAAPTSTTTSPPAGTTPHTPGTTHNSPGTTPNTPTDPDDFNTLGMTWAGTVALDVCALVCRGSRVLSDDHFVFFNNERTPDGSVRMVPAAAGDRAAIRVAFDALPTAADRLVMVAAVDPVVNPEADLSGFIEAGIRLRDRAGTELDRLDVSDGRPGETALVLGSFRRRAGGDWDFVPGGKGYRSGLGGLVGDFGIDTE
ncbi:restriction endonuclease [Streptomyces sp. NBC_01317]|uniref:restriction endonuclease n=1 Tax=Streptomyces sp. NBC_01317 TaxID=2903822 RepID=UPI002E13224C|nr:restriction endonuclease [Streptomyces sp. NBC_01317]